MSLITKPIVKNLLSARYRTSIHRAQRNQADVVGLLDSANRVHNTEANKVIEVLRDGPETNLTPPNYPVDRVSLGQTIGVEG
jgi:hypothetical protein